VAKNAETNWQAVSEFMSELQNASRLAALVDAVVDMYESGAWREYTDKTGSLDRWRECEYDYFLIACGAQYPDVEKLLTWDRARAAELASAMASDDEQRRRPLDKASAAWHSPTGTPLTELARQNGWTTAAGAPRVSPVPARARTLARHGMTMDEQARQRREQKIPAERRSQLGDRLDELASGLSVLELRYVRDLLTAKLRAPND